MGTARLATPGTGGKGTSRPIGSRLCWADGARYPRERLRGTTPADLHFAVEEDDRQATVTGCWTMVTDQLAEHRMTSEATVAATRKMAGAEIGLCSLMWDD